MNNLRLLLLEDLDEEATDIIEFLEDNNYEVIRVKKAVEAEKEIKNRFFDIILLDIMIDGKPEGISLAHRLNKQHIETPFLFLTSMQSKAVFDEAKLTKPYTYLLKPFNKLELLYSLELALEKFHEQSSSISLSDKNAIVSPSFLFVKKKRSIMKVDTASIIYIEVKEKYCKLVCNEGDFLIKLSLTKIKELLGDTNFTQTHRNYLVNTNKIKEIYFEDNLLILENSNKILFSERFKNQFIKSNTIFR
ncbi:LytR/AlgR family response regulator transcription factor [Tenacibaculum aestuariivivum]|uniref:LytR/AlgR family response regulator transcription factor n=1 Tax=Tenacibaculum aestuariivivum TaxID=2006131 RepID=UPI003AB5DDFB